MTVEEFIQKWFKLPYVFFYRHGLVRLVLQYGVPEAYARIITFFFYSASWELILVLATGVTQAYAFKLLMISLVWHIIQLRLPPLHPQTFNTAALFGLLAVIPLITCLYTREYINLQTH